MFKFIYLFFFLLFLDLLFITFKVFSSQMITFNGVREDLYSSVKMYSALVLQRFIKNFQDLEALITFSDNLLISLAFLFVYLY